MIRRVFGPEHEELRQRVRAFLADEVVPGYAEWEDAGRPPRWFWERCAALGLLGVGVPEHLGGLPGSTFKHSAIVTEEAQRAGLSLGGLRVHTDICMPYFLEYADPEQQARWVPRLTAGTAIAALAMSEPAAGSDVKALATQARRDGDHYVVDGAKTFITNGLTADLVILAVKTDPAAGRDGITLLVVDAATPGFTRGRKLEKLGLRTQDLSELFFTELVVPVADRLGQEGDGFRMLIGNLAQERLSIALNSQAAAAATLARTVRRYGGADAGQHARFELAGCAAEVRAGQAFADEALEALVDGVLTPDDAAAVKLYCTELQSRLADRCLQVAGPEAYDRDDPLGRAFVDARVSRIYGGSSEIMKVIVAKGLEPLSGR